MAGACLNLLARTGRMPRYPRHYFTFSGTGHRHTKIIIHFSHFRL